MFDETQAGEASPIDSLVSLPSDAEWQPILHASNQVVLYNPTSHALTIQRHTASSGVADVVRRHDAAERCPFCHRPMAGGEVLEVPEFDEEIERGLDDIPTSRAANYFQLLQLANESSVPPTPRSPSPVGRSSITGSDDNGGGGGDAFRADTMAEGYFKAFFREESRLGMGANGSVFLCEHVLNGNPLGWYAVKKIAVGQSHSYLMNILREVRLLEKLHHPNIITYHHAWLEPSQFSSFGPKVPTLHVLMQWAEGGSLDDFIDARLGRSSKVHMPHPHQPGQPMETSSSSQSMFDSESTSTPYSRGARIRAFRALQRAAPEDRTRLRRELATSISAGQPSHEGNSTGNWLAVHLLSAEEVKALFTDVVQGLAFLHDRSILHLDLKPGNVLLTWEPGKLIPTAMLSDFGTSQDMLNSRTRSGNTGTLEYTSPESLPSPSTGLLSQIDSKSDMWSLGMILHKLLFLRLPYQYASDNMEQDSKRDDKEIADALEREVLSYPGFKSTASAASSFESRHLPRAFLILLEGLLNVNSSVRPTSERVLFAIHEGRLDPIPAPSTSSRRSVAKTSLVPILRRTPPADHLPPDGNQGVHDIFTPSVSGVEALHTTEEKADGVDVYSPHSGLPSSESTGRLSPIENEDSDARRWISRIVLTRTIKSSLLVVKVLTLSGSQNSARLSLVLKSLALVAAVVDTVV